MGQRPGVTGGGGAFGRGPASRLWHQPQFCFWNAGTHGGGGVDLARTMAWSIAGRHGSLVALERGVLLGSRDFEQALAGPHRSTDALHFGTRSIAFDGRS